MLIYRTDDEAIDAAAAWQALVRRVCAGSPAASHDEITALLIEAGELESAITDQLFPDCDSVDPLIDALAGATLAVGRLFVCSWQARSNLNAARAGLMRAMKRVPEEAIPRRASRRISEGYAYYALHPETYSLAANWFADATGPPAVVTIGIRSIGTSLSAVVAATLARRGIPVRAYSVRPRGHPFNRTLRLSGYFQALLRASAADAWYAIVDEGPGLSGSSFAAVARALRDLGIRSDRIVMFPSWNADGSAFRSADARESWQRHARWVATSDEARAGLGALVGDRRSVDWSAGRWRDTEISPAADWPPVHAQHERVKRLLPDERQILRFAGLGRYGTTTHARAAMLASGGFGCGPLALTSGYLRLPCLAGAPLIQPTAEAIDFIGRYAAFVERHFPADRCTPLELLHQMIETNCSEADPSIVVPALGSFGSALTDLRPTLLDARMLVHEFIRTPGALAKTDTLDHGADHFFPGPQDIAWDLAAAEAEFDLDDEGRQALLQSFRHAGGDPAVAARMDFFRLAYAAYQLGYADMACQSLGESRDGRLFRARGARFLARLRALTGR